MKTYRRHEDATVATTNPVSEEIKIAAVAGTVAAVTVVSKASSDLYDLGKEGVRWAWNKTAQFFAGSKKEDNQTK